MVTPIIKYFCETKVEKGLVTVIIIIITIIYFVLIRGKPRIGAEIPRFSTFAALWNLFFCPNKIQNYRLLTGTYLIQTLQGTTLLALKEKIFLISWGGYKYILLLHPDTAQEVLKSYSIINKDWLYNILHPWLGTGLLTSSDNKWRNRRKLLTPAFHFRILEDFQYIFNNHSNILIEKLKKRNKNEIFHMNEIITPCTLDVIGESAMGVHIDAQGRSDNDYVHAINNITSSMVLWFTYPWYWFRPILNVSSLGKKMKRNIEIIHQFDRKVITERKEKLIEELEENQTLDNFQQDKEDIGIKKRRAFLNLLLYHHLTDGSLNENDIREEVDTFMFEGHDTTSMGITWTLYLLGLHRDIQERIFKELKDIFSDDINKSITTEDLKQMKYLECVIKESLRIYPPVPYILRKATSEIKVGEYIIPTNSSIVVSIYSIHHNPTVFENPEIFDPDRFLPENCEKRHPFAFLPFSVGPRNCIGQRFAMMEMKTILANILRNFAVHSLDSPDKVLVSGDIILRPKFGIRMSIKTREFILDY